MQIDIGVTLQVLGVFVSGFAFWRTWREFASSDERFLAPFTGPARAAFDATAGALERAVRWSLRRRNDAVSRPLTLSASASMSTRLSVRIVYGPLPLEAEKALADLHGRTQELRDLVSETKEELTNDRANVRDAVGSLRKELEGATQRLERRSQRVAIGGIRGQVVGLFLIGLGLLLQGWEIRP